MYKKIAIVTAFILLLSAVPCAAVQFPDTAGQPCEAAARLLSDIGVVEGKGEGLFDPAASLTRAEMTTIIVRLLGVTPPKGDAGVFEDVTPEHWAFDDICFAYAMGLVNGMDDTHFAPVAPLSHPQAVKMLVCALGYGVQAESMGGFPTGYLAKAAQLGLLQNVGAAMTRGDMAILVDNALKCDILVRKGDTYTEKPGATLLNTYLHIEEEEGRITDNGAVNLNPALRVKTGSIVLDGSKKFAIGQSDAASYIGRQVKLYVRETDTEPTVISVRPIDKTTVMEVDAADIDGDKSTNSRLYYDDGKDIRYVSIAKNAVFAYNGEMTDSLTLPTRGKVTCICDDGNMISVVMTYDYVNAVVKGKDAETDTVYFKEAVPFIGTELVISASDSNIRFINADGTDATVGQCAEWNILSISRSADGSRTTVVRTDKKVAGKVTEYDGKSATVGESGTFEMDIVVEHGMTGRFYLDAYDRIAAADTSPSAVVEAAAKGMQYGYLVSTGMTKGLDNSPMFKIFGQDGVMQVYGIGTRINIKHGFDSVQAYKPSDFFLSANNNIAVKEFELMPQLVRFAANNEELIITDLETYVEGTTEEIRENYFSLDESVSSPTIYLGGQLRTFLSRYYVGNNCIIFNMPPAYSDNDKDYRIVKPTELQHAVEYRNLKFFDIDRGNRVGAIVMTDTVVQTVGNDSMIGVITDVSTKIDEMGEEVIGISLTNYKGAELKLTASTDFEVLFGTNGEAKNVITNPATETETVNGRLKDKISPLALNRGDVVAYDTAGDKVTVMAVRFRAAHPIYREMGMNGGNATVSTRDNSYTSQVFWYNKVERVTNETMVVHMPATSGVDQYWVRVEPFKSEAKFFRFDTKKGTLTPSSPDAITENSNVFVYRETLYPHMVILYK